MAQNIRATSKNIVSPLRPTNTTQTVQALANSDGDGTLGDMSDRLTALETHFGYVRKDLDTLASGQRDIHAALTEVSKGLVNVGVRIDVQSAEARSQAAESRLQLAALPAKATLWGMIGTVVAVGIAISGLTFVIADWVKAMPPS